MIKENGGYSPRHKSQLEIVNGYRKQLELLSPEIKLRIKQVTYKEGEEVTRGFRIILNENSSAKVGLITDWDDTLETYTNRKPKYFASLFKIIEEKNNINEEVFINICKAINKSARVLNWQETHPENYSPLLEMVTESQLLEDITANSQEESFLNLINLPSEQNARIYIMNKIVPKFGDSLKIVTKNSKIYFKEGKHQSMAHTLEEKNDFINEQIWLVFNETMTQSNLTNDEIQNFDLDENVYWAISSFGAVEFQLIKIINSLLYLARNGKRMPNEIMIITHGRKRQALLEIRDEKPELKWIYVDDSHRQLEKMKNDGITLVNAKRYGAKRTDEESEFQTVNMNEPLSNLINLKD